MPRERRFPLDLDQGGYAYLERPNAALVSLIHTQLLEQRAAPRLLDLGCGAGANARRIRELCPGAYLAGVEPNPAAAKLAADACDEVFEGTVANWLDGPRLTRFDAVILSDLLEHLPDPVALLRRLLATPALDAAAWFISVPNYAVWYNRLRTVVGRFDYAWSGLYDRTHLRFFTQRSLRRLLEHCGLEITAERCTPSLLQSAAPLLRQAYSAPLKAGHTLALDESPAYHWYARWIEPAETRICGVWPALMGFQIVVSARCVRGSP